MILSSVVKHVREQNWFAVGVDFLVVVVGVFIGIQVSNWIEQRQSQTELDASLENLAQEISNTASMRENHLEFQRSTIQGFSFVLDLLEGVELDDEKQELAFTALARGFPPPSPSRYVTLYGLQSTDRLRNISSERLRGALGELLSQDRLYPRYLDYWMRFISTPPLSTAIVSYGLSREDGRISTRVTEIDIQKARDDPDFRTRVIQMYSLWETVAFANEGSLRMDRIVLEILESEGFSPSGNWLEQNLERIYPEPSNVSDEQG